MELSPCETADLSMIWSVKNRISHKKNGAVKKRAIKKDCNHP